MTKYLKVFLASSINEFRIERMDFGNFIRILNDRLETYNVEVELYLCEDIDNSLALSRKQDEYNAIIRECDIFMILVGKTLGAYTLEEYNVALNSLNERLVYLKNGESDNTVTAFKEYAKDNKIDFINFKEVKIDFLKYVLKKLDLLEHLKFENNKYRFDGRIITGL